ncbi:hypothetical protein PM3016_4784 [Paenibacillus mucilaginosus 3016]|uniref:Uncharacterized protein n=2 Tax=Paenibacillus mucilaginosus TaxID=61624 RepID=H6NIB9_9BACL|nr:hypothetical protein [Paenibacillus mucilaginosus]AFC31522.1 hypothetical protein PM3016_4784 [Paenibacillus mucilaginosus 3016]AFH63866.1 hypothetical protein B2K_24800 [Paenibacillus mucilaginosus K02]WFA20063.1 hypothetical protein ERY13_23920 [Paenibacillus mucilaginosus]
MEDQVTQILERIRFGEALCELDSAKSRLQSGQLQELIGHLDRMREHFSTMHALPEERSEVMALRQSLADLRVELRPCIQDVEAKLEESLKEYRSALGGDKEAFEKLSEAEQEGSRPLAYRFKKDYRTLKDLSELLSLLSADLMNLSDRVEHHFLHSHPAPEIGDYEYRDNVPAPGSISP